MRVARAQHTILFMDTQVSLFQDLSTLTLDARRALRPLTRLLQEKRVLYKWGFPLSLQIKVDNYWQIIRWPINIPCFPWAAGLPNVAIPNWIFDNPPARTIVPTDAAHNITGEPATGPQQRQGGLNDPED
ncbi:Hypothetical predicted protein [Pelobates cultripes]|uniref:Uncharacterized protein n=1 Tax=Pelobates cultripes TaxID=61616 RepID=A0AAD1T2I0_PELCU|nr:Hypothetical predicted protein [Pelobates cultripes]